MKIFSYLYNKTLRWSSHAHAPYYLAGVSFAESSFFPIPPDVMLVSMGLAKPERSWRYALIATLFSALGGILGYCIGFFFMEAMEPYLMTTSYAHDIVRAMHWFDKWGVWVVFLAAFSPIPYKVFTVASGALQLALFPFIIASLIGRGLRFFLVSAILYYLGDYVELHLRRYVDIIGWSIVIIFGIVYCMVKWVL